MIRTPRLLRRLLAVTAAATVVGGLLTALPAAAATTHQKAVKKHATVKTIKKKVSPVPAPAPTTVTWWKPVPGLTWQIQFTGTLDTSVQAAVYDVDGADTPASTVAALKAAGRRTICYVDVGSYENWRTDAATFPSAVLGADLTGWAGERWLDIRQWTVLQPIIAARFAACKAKGFDAVDPDNVDGYSNTTGFALTAADQLTYNRRIAALAHQDGLAVGLKNDVDQVTALAPSFDFAVNESCADYSECATETPFVTANKAVFQIEYDLAVSAFCGPAKALRFSSVRKHQNLNAWRQTC